ncbi:glycosyltransferase [Candidatus Gottesmanbacteria bacterium]|nr:glycosyltransferase [Candidatus Gottesmanbacteria bacterium]MBI5465055.1 glycosyltransferase [Candidatus Gottesmanbacteria bacterium]
MRIGIDISQIAYEGTGVANYARNLVENLLRIDKENEYILFFSSLRREIKNEKWTQSKIATPANGGIKIKNDNVKLKKFKFPPIFLDFLWNRLHILPIENLIGDVDVFITSDWTEPPTKKAKKATIIYDLIVYKHPEETDKRIVETQKRKLEWVKKESDLIICISEATKKDAMEILGIEEKRLKVIYPGGLPFTP